MRPGALILGELITELVVWIHLLAAMVWVGGLVFLGLVAVPASRTVSGSVERAQLIRSIGRRFAVLALFALGVAVITGWWLASRSLEGWSALVTTSYGRLLLFKIALVGVGLVLTLVHILALGPAMSAARARSSPAPRLTLASRAVNLALLIDSLAIVYVAVILAG